MKKYSIFLLMLVLVIAFFGGQCPDPKPGTPIEITILHTNDIHSQFRQEIGEKNPYNLGGLARLKTLVDQMRNLKKNSILLDAGDWSEGTVFFHSDAGSNVLSIMNEIGYQAAAVGNHDFLNGPVELANTIERANISFPILGANKDLSAVSDRDRVSRLVQDYVILNVGDVKIAVIGLMTEEFLYYEYFKDGVITSATKRASELAEKIHDQKLADVIVLLSHNAFDMNVRLARVVPYVNVVVSGHSHRKVIEPVVVSNGGEPAYIVEAKQWGQFLGSLTLLVDKKQQKVRLKEFELIPVNTAEDPKINTMIEEQERILMSKYGSQLFSSRLAEFTDYFAQSDFKETPLGNLVADAYREAAGTQIGIESATLVAIPISPGYVSLADVINIVPHIYRPKTGKSWTIHRALMLGSDIKAISNLILLADKLEMPLAFLNVSGAQVHFTKNGDDPNPLKDFRVYDAGTFVPIKNDVYYSVAFNDGLYLSLRIFREKFHLDIDLSRITDTGIEVWTAVRDFITKRKIIRASDFIPSNRYVSVDPDLGVYENDITVKKDSNGKYVVKVRVKNYGLVASGDGYKLTVFRGGPNDPIHDGLDEHESVPVSASVTLSSIKASEETVIGLPWEDLPTPGMYGLRVELTSNQDGNKTNNKARIHYQTYGL